MEGRRWNETQDALLEIAEYALKLNVRSVSLRFLNSTIYDQGVQVRVRTTLHDPCLTFNRVLIGSNRILTALRQLVQNKYHRHTRP